MIPLSAWDIWWWVILPYIAIVVFVVGHIWRWRYDQFGWTSHSTQLQERRLLKWAHHCSTTPPSPRSSDTSSAYWYPNRSPIGSASPKPGIRTFPPSPGQPPPSAS
ncbi:nitrate reductase gamma subunit [Mycobacterium xenopi 3993]|nr:nitrate reductase gamma subunit [Mycobacterium xenopi 3993]